MRKKSTIATDITGSGNDSMFEDYSVASGYYSWLDVYEKEILATGDYSEIQDLIDKKLYESYEDEDDVRECLEDNNEDPDDYIF